MAYTKEQLVEKAKGYAAKYGIAWPIWDRLIGQESNWKVDAVSKAGAQGLTQLMPGTARDLGVSNPFDPDQALDGGARYLRQQLDTFGTYVKGLAAYNAGPGTIQKWNGARATLPPETQLYLDKILGPDWTGGGTVEPGPITVTPAPGAAGSLWETIKGWARSFGGQPVAGDPDNYDVWAPISLTIVGTWCIGIGVSAAIVRSTPVKIATEVAGAVGPAPVRVGAAVAKIAQSDSGDSARRAVRSAGTAYKPFRRARS